MKVLILGASGMLGNAVFSTLSERKELDVWGTLRSHNSIHYFSNDLSTKLVGNIDVLDWDVLIKLIEAHRPDAVVNCVGLIKQHSISKDPLVTLPLNSMLPHRLAALCSLVGARLIHVSTDCVFSGKQGNYTEASISDAEDLYGKSKYIGELHDLPHAITIRTSIIGHELNSAHSLVDWFLAQEGTVKGYRKAIFSGLPTIEIARIILEYILPNPSLSGLYHVSSSPIDKFSLLNIIAEIYCKDIQIIPDDAVCIDRSLDSTLFKNTTGYTPPSWTELVSKMHSSHSKFICEN